MEKKKEGKTGIWEVTITLEIMIMIKMIPIMQYKQKTK